MFRVDLRAVPVAHGKSGEDASVADVLAKQVPTELIAPSTALTAAIVGAVAKPTKGNPSPDQLAGWRWASFAVLVGSVILLVGPLFVAVGGTVVAGGTAAVLVGPTK